MNTKHILTVEIRVKGSIDNVWKYWTMPEHITMWNFASDDWYCPTATNILKPEGRFSSRMEARDGSFGFDFSGTYKKVEHHRQLISVLDDNRTVETTFQDLGDEIRIVECFEPEDENAYEDQLKGWQMILDNFKKYVESIT